MPAFGAPAFSILVTLWVMFRAVIPVLRENTIAQINNAAATTALAEVISHLPNVTIEKILTEHQIHSETQHAEIIKTLSAQESSVMRHFDRLEALLMPANEREK